MKQTIIQLLAMIVLTAGISSCNNDDEPKVDTPEGITMTLKTLGDQEPEYVITQENIMEGVITAEGTGFESFDWNFSYSVGPSLFVLGYTNFEAQVYQRNEEGDVVEAARFILDAPLEVFGQIGDEFMLAIDAPRDGSHSGRKLYTMDAASGAVADIQDITIMEVDTGTPGEGMTAWPTALQVVGGHLFISFYPVDDNGYYTTPDPNKAHVAVYDYPLTGTDPIKIIEDDRTGNIGVNGTNYGLIQTETGDIYSYSSGAYVAGFLPVSDKPSGVLRIREGETDFDTEYFFDVENAPNGGIIFWFDYVGNGKALARLIDEDTDPADDPDYALYWGAFGRSLFNQKLVIIDLESQLITPVANVPLHAKRYSTSLLVEDGKTYVSVETENEAYVYQVDINEATAVRGAEIQGKTIKGFSRLD